MVEVNDELISEKLFGSIGAIGDALSQQALMCRTAAFYPTVVDGKFAQLD